MALYSAICSSGGRLGLFCAFIIPVGQIFLAAFLALPARANVPLATLSTFITNPFTVPFWLGVAKIVGEFVLRIDQAAGGFAAGRIEAEYGVWLVWLFETAAVIAFGFIVLAVVSAGLGYVISGFAWRFIVSKKRAKRLLAMEARLDRRLKHKAEAGQK